jgi:hypothetical protein
MAQAWADPAAMTLATPPTVSTIAPLLEPPEDVLELPLPELEPVGPLPPLELPPVEAPPDELEPSVPPVEPLRVVRPVVPPPLELERSGVGEEGGQAQRAATAARPRLRVTTWRAPIWQ